MDEIEAQELGVSDEERAKRQRILDKRSGRDLEKKWAQTDRALIEAREKDIAPPEVIEPRCRVCTSPFRSFIEEAVVRAYSYQSIEKKVPLDEDGKGVDRRSISNHYRNHMDLEKQRIRSELEEEAKLIGQNVDTAPQGALTDRGMLKVVARRAFDDVLKGVTTAEVKDLIQIVKLLNDIEVKAAGDRAEENEVALRTFVRAIQNVCDQITIGNIVKEAERLREIDDVQYAMEGIIIRPEPALIEASAEEAINDN